MRAYKPLKRVIGRIPHGIHIKFNKADDEIGYHTTREKKLASELIVSNSTMITNINLRINITMHGLSVC